MTPSFVTSREIGPGGLVGVKREPMVDLTVGFSVQRDLDETREASFWGSPKKTWR